MESKTNISSDKLHLKLDPMMQMHYKMKFHNPFDLIPVVIQLTEPLSHELKNSILDWGGNIKGELSIIQGFCGDIPYQVISELISRPEVDFVSYDHKVHALLDIASHEVGSAFAMDLGYTGQGITVAVLDTGIYPHDDLSTPINRIIAFKDFVNKIRNPYDDNGHGTHLAGCIAGNGRSSEGKYMGIAPKASLLGVKVLDNTGAGFYSDIILGLQWVLETKNRYRTKLVCIASGAMTMTPYRKDPMCRAVDHLIDNGLVVIISAGNCGPHEGTILSPGITPAAITVGAADDRRTYSIIDDNIAAFSSRGPTLDGTQKPDISAPGVGITSLATDINYFPYNSLNLISPYPLSKPYHTLSGTSVAAAITTGAAALLLEKKPNSTSKEIKDVIIKYTTDLKIDNHAQGAGIINLRKLLNI